MTIPSPGLSDTDTYEHGRPSPVDLPYINTRSPSGDHLIPPSPVRRHAQELTSWAAGSQTSFHDEPGDMDHRTSQATADYNSSATLQSYHGGHTQSFETLTREPHHPSPLHQSIAVRETLPGASEAKPSSSLVHHHSDTNRSEPYRIGTPSSFKSSAMSISQKSSNSRMSNGRGSYREHHGPSARVHTPVSDQCALVHCPLPAPTTAEPGGMIALPGTDRPRQPSESTNSSLRFFPMSVTGLLRYECRKTRRLTKKYNFDIEALSYRFPTAPKGVPEGWMAYRHPEGVLYFVHTESKTFTDVDMCDDDIHRDIEQFRTFLFSELKTLIKQRDLSDSLDINEVQLVLEPKLDELGLMCCYYFVSPPTRTLFWLDEWEAYEIFKDCRDTLSLPHKGLGVEAHYCWLFVVDNLRLYRSHWNLYPNFCTVTQELKDEVVDMILHATCDHLTSNTSSCPLTPKELKEHLYLIERIDPKKTEGRKHCVVIMGRIMHTFYTNYFLNYHGEECARLNFHQRVHGWRYRPSLWMKVFAPLLFMAPTNNVRLLHRIFVDDIANKEKWNMFVAKLNSQLQETSVLATVLLNANVAFLPKQSGTGTSPQEFLSYTSLVANVASIILGLVFMGHSHIEARNNPFKAAVFLHGSWNEKHGLEKLAIVYSLPQAFLMWGMCLFFAAFVTQWMDTSNMKLRGGAATSIAVTAVFVAWCIWTARDRSASWWFQADPGREHSQEEDDERENFAHTALDLVESEGVANFESKIEK